MIQGIYAIVIETGKEIFVYKDRDTMTYRDLDRHGDYYTPNQLNFKNDI